MSPFIRDEIEKIKKEEQMFSSMADQKIRERDLGLKSAGHVLMMSDDERKHEESMRNTYHLAHMSDDELMELAESLSKDPVIDRIIEPHVRKEDIE